MHLLAKGGTSNHEHRGNDSPNLSKPAHGSTGIGRADWAAKEWGNIAQYEMGYRTPKRDKLNKMAHALKVPEERFSLEAGKTPQTLLHNLLWLDQDHTSLIELHLLNKENCPRPYDQTPKGCIAIVIHDKAVQNFLRDWSTEKSLLEAGAITQEDYFDWKIRTPVVNHCLGPSGKATDS